MSGSLDPKDPKREQRRIQAIVDKTFTKGHHLSLDQCSVGKELGTGQEPYSVGLQSTNTFVDDLAKTVAKEKVKNIDRQRRAIRKLGEEKLYQFIQHIFFELSKGEYNAALTADQYGISKSTVSRFAGSNWHDEKRGPKAVKIPDLWRNTARILSQNSVFMETVLTSGILGRFEKVLRIIDCDRGKRNDR